MLSERFQAMLNSQPHAAADSTAVAEYRLYHRELFWRDHYAWLQEKGYVLRPRYHPEWVASWKGTDKFHLTCEDGRVTEGVGIMLDATRQEDGAQVMLKRVRTSTNPDEANIGRLLSSEPYASHPSNYCVPVYDVLQVPDEEGLALIVMPFLRYWEFPAFETIGEVVEFFRQLFEGVRFMHSLNIAHNDIKSNNVMMDPSPLHDELVHPAYMGKVFDYSRKAKKPESRTVRPVRYYLIDFGNAEQYNVESGPPLSRISGRGYGGDLSVPEFETQEVCDPFAVDVYRVGNIIKQRFTHKNTVLLGKPTMKGFKFMKRLAEDMCQDDPTKRPTMEEVVVRFAKIVEGLSGCKLRSPIASKGEAFGNKFRRFPSHWKIQIGRMIKGIPPIPSA